MNEQAVVLPTEYPTVVSRPKKPDPSVQRIEGAAECAALSCNTIHDYSRSIHKKAGMESTLHASDPLIPFVNV